MIARVLVGIFSLSGLVAFFGAYALDKMRSDFNVRYFKVEERGGMSESMFMAMGIVSFVFGLCIWVGLVSI